jgi:hypothetical protein
MAITQALLDAVIDYSWADIAKMAKKALIELTISQSTTINGRTLQRASIKDLKTLYELAVEQTTVQNGINGGGDVALVRYGERV